VDGFDESDLGEKAVAPSVIGLTDQSERLTEAIPSISQVDD